MASSAARSPTSPISREHPAGTQGFLAGSHRPDITILGVPSTTWFVCGVSESQAKPSLIDEQLPNSGNAPTKHTVRSQRVRGRDGGSAFSDRLLRAKLCFGASWLVAALGAWSGWKAPAAVGTGEAGCVWRLRVCW